MKSKVVLMVVAAIMLPLASCGSHEYAGSSRSPVPEVGEIVLPNLSDRGRPFALTAPDNGLLLVFFGYTSCPDFCPETMSNLSAVEARLGDDETGRIKVVMITVDPVRDESKLAAYVESFIPGSIALGTPDPQLLAAAAEPFGVTYVVTPIADTTDVEVVHTSALFAVNDQGQLVMTWSYGITPDQLEGDVKALLARDGEAVAT